MTNDLTEYAWWGEKNSPPDNLKTKKQLTEMGLSPRKPVGVIRTRKYECFLYDVDNPESAKSKRKASEAQLKALEKGRKEASFKAWKRSKDFDLYYYRNQSVKWAKEVISNPQNYLILDTETTGLGNAEVCQIAIIDLSGNVLFDSLVKPSISIPVTSSGIHGINDKMVANAPKFPEVYPQIKEVLGDKKEIVIYNDDFDKHILNYCCILHHLPKLGLAKRTHCAMHYWSMYVAEWSDYYHDYKWQPLNGGHTAISDCQKTLELIQEMADKPLRAMREIFDSFYED